MSRLCYGYVKGATLGRKRFYLDLKLLIFAMHILFKAQNKKYK